MRTIIALHQKAHSAVALRPRPISHRERMLCGVESISNYFRPSNTRLLKALSNPMFATTAHAPRYQGGALVAEHCAGKLCFAARGGPKLARPPFLSPLPAAKRSLSAKTEGLHPPKTRIFAKQSQFLLCRAPKNKANSKPNKPNFRAKQSQFEPVFMPQNPFSPHLVSSCLGGELPLQNPNRVKPRQAPSRQVLKSPA